VLFTRDQMPDQRLGVQNNRFICSYLLGKTFPDHQPPSQQTRHELRAFKRLARRAVGQESGRRDHHVMAGSRFATWPGAVLTTVPGVTYLSVDAITGQLDQIERAD
jgi:hypothetical protein